MQRIAPCLWFDDRAEEAAEFYAAIFKNSRIVNVSRYGEAGREFHGKEPGTVMTVGFELDGQPFTALLRRATVPVQRGSLVSGLVRDARGGG